jgi:hypothetical protein
MKYFLDTEFIEDGKTIDLISIGIVCEDGRKYYAISTEFKAKKANQWVKDHVLSQLPPKNANPYESSPSVWEASKAWKKPAVIRDEVLEFCNPDKYGTPEFWGYYADYDWVVFCWLFGVMMDLPKGFPMYCNDIRQVAKELGDPELPEQDEHEHHALADAIWNKEAYEFLQGLR